MDMDVDIEMNGTQLLQLEPNELLRKLASDQQQRLMEALTLTAGREKGAGIGGYVYQLAQQVSALNQWLRAFDNGVVDFMKWTAITQEASFYWSEWYDWYTRFYTRRDGMNDGLSLDDLVALGGMENIGLMLHSIEAERKTS